MSDLTRIYHRIGIHRDDHTSHDSDTGTRSEFYDHRYRDDRDYSSHHRDSVRQPRYETDRGSPDHDLRGYDLRGPSPSRERTAHHSSPPSRYRDDYSYHHSVHDPRDRVPYQSSPSAGAGLVSGAPAGGLGSLNQGH